MIVFLRAFDKYYIHWYWTSCSTCS